MIIVLALLLAAALVRAVAQPSASSAAGKVKDRESRMVSQVASVSMPGAEPRGKQSGALASPVLSPGGATWVASSREFARNLSRESERAADSTLAEAREGAPGEPLDVLVLGVDRRPDGTAESMGTRSDTMMVVRIEPARGEVRVLSIPRDLLVEIRPGVEDRINAAYAYDGVEGAKDVVETVTGIRVDNYAVVDFAGFTETIDAIGGVEVDVKEDLPGKWGIGRGRQRLDGPQALFYARYRGTPGGDLDRIGRQQQLVAALREQALGWNAITGLPEIARVAKENVSSDMGLMEAISLGRLVILHGRDARTVTDRLEGTPATLPNGDQVLVPDREANESVLQDFRG